ncbi:MAG: hypothetical protein QXI16_01470 [Sulfolobaceae archaeon]
MKGCDDFNEVENITTLIYPDRKFKNGEEMRNTCNEIVKDLKDEFKNYGHKEEKEDFIFDWADRNTPIYSKDVVKWYNDNVNRLQYADDYLNDVGYNDESVETILQRGEHTYLEQFAHNIIGD